MKRKLYTHETHGWHACMHEHVKTCMDAVGMNTHETHGIHAWNSWYGCIEFMICMHDIHGIHAWCMVGFCLFSMSCMWFLFVLHAFMAIHACMHPSMVLFNMSCYVSLLTCHVMSCHVMRCHASMPRVHARKFFNSCMSCWAGVGARLNLAPAQAYRRHRSWQSSPSDPGTMRL